MEKVKNTKAVSWFDPKASLNIIDTEKPNTIRNQDLGGYSFTEKLPDGMMKDMMKFMASEMLHGRMSFDLPIKLNGKYTTLEFITIFH